MSFRLRICSLLFVASLISCTSPVNETSSNQNTTSEYEIVTKQEISLANFFLQEEEDYLVFCHSETCQQCKEIKGDVAEFAQDNIVKTYFLNVSISANKIRQVPIDNITVGIDNLDDLCYAGTPTLFEIKKGVTIANVPGKDKCRTYLNELRKNQKSENTIA